MNSSNAIVPGSLAWLEQQTGKSIVDLMMEVDMILICDTSASMTDPARKDESGQWKTRYDVLVEHVQRLQAAHPGKLVILNFSDDAQWEFGGIPRLLNGSTELTYALEQVVALDIDGSGIDVVLISDGEPADEDGALELVHKHFKQTKIHTIYIGPEGGSGHKFLQQLAKGGHGKAMREDAEMKLLEEKVTALLPSGGKNDTPITL